MKTGRYVDIISGTSLDGIDVVLAAIDEHSMAQQSRYSWTLDNRLGILFAEAVLRLLQQTGVAPHEVTAIACHGA